MAALRRTRSVPSQRPRPIVTLTTDFGLADYYVAAMKAVLIAACPDVRVIDVTHNVLPQDILCGSITLERAIEGFPPGTVHLAIVDPGVGTDRRAIVVEINRQRVVCPDNGLITWAWRRHGPGRVHEITWRPAKRLSHTFHGRDIFAPVAGRIANGESIESVARPVDDDDLVLLPVEPAQTPRGLGAIIHFDHFGNATTNISYDLLRQADGVDVRVRGKRLGSLRKTYWDVPPGKPLALIGSSGLLEIAVRDGSAAKQLRLKVGDAVEVR